MLQNLFDSLLYILGETVPFFQENPIFLYLAALGISTILFFLVREIMCWYWKINRFVAILEKIEANIGDTNFILRNNSKANTAKQSSTVEDLRKELTKDHGLF